jgi:predicted nucleotidyltransferase
VLRDLDALGFVSRHLVGRAHAYALERSNIYVRTMVLPAVEAERFIADELRRDLRDEFAHESLSLILFGSYAFGEQDESSDIDVFALVEGALQKQRIEERARESGIRFRTKYGSPVSLMVYTKAQTREHLLDGKSAFGVELAATGIILHGLGVEEWGTDAEEYQNSGCIEGGGAPVHGEGGGVR